MNTYADVAIPLAVDKVFTYLIPPELRQSAAIGTRAIVPFGRIYATGLIVALPRESTMPSLKPVKDVIDPAPIVSEELLHLCRWIAEYYFAPLGEVFKAAIPHGFTSSNKRLVLPTSAITRALIEEMGKHAPKRAKLLTLLLDQKKMVSTDLQKRVGLKTINAVLNELAQSGYIETEELIPRPATKPKTKEFIQLENINQERLTAELQLLTARKKKAQELLRSIQLLKGEEATEIGVTDLLKKAGTSSATLREFRASGLIPVVRKEITRQQEYGTEEQTRTIVLNASQQLALATMSRAIDAGRSQTVLLHGVTGSGKTQVYIEAIRSCLQHNKTAIVLVPEISLTPQIVRRFKTHFADQVAVVHSRMSVGERHDVWRLALRGDCRIVIGPRSAVFAPLRNLGLIVVDEEHEASYKQYDATPRYNARDVAVVRGNFNNAVVVLGSATPSAESYYNAANGKYLLVEMPSRIEAVRMPDITIVDMTAERKRTYTALKESLPEEKRMKLKDFQQPAISTLLQAKIEERLSRREGTILLQNRRGFAPFVECPDCGYTETCRNCNVTLTYHLSKRHLRCHYCGMVRAPHTECPQCHGTNIQLHGIGTQRVEQELLRLFPRARVLRMDLDSTSRKGAHDRLLRKFGNGEADILLGTQMVAKGLDFPRVTLVGVISADTQMLLPDFRSSERTFQLLTQVAGRAGRSTLRGEVIIQTHQPQHYTLEHVVDHDFKTFYEQELQGRKELDYPPFSRIVLIESKGGSEEAVKATAERFAKLLKETNGTFTVLGPSPAVIGKINNQHRWHIIIKNMKTQDPSGSHLRRALHKVLLSFDARRKRNVRLIIDVDPVGMM